MEAPYLPHLADRFELRSILGQGAFGITYLAIDRASGASVAIKEYFPRKHARRLADGSVAAMAEASAETFAWGLRRFADEGHMVARYHHPSVVRVLSVFDAAGSAYIVMGYEAGETLERAVRGGREFADATLRTIAFSLSNGLRLFHDDRIIHRDIKPANILIRDDDVPVLLDFGSARQAFGDEIKAFKAIVTPGYAAPEQYDSSAESGRRQGPWTDVYALSASLYRVVSGAPPADARERIRALVGARDPLVPVHEAARPGYSPALLAAIDAGLTLSWKERPGSLQDWCALLTAAPPRRTPAGAVDDIEFEDDDHGHDEMASDDDAALGPWQRRPVDRRRRRIDWFTWMRRIAQIGAVVAVLALLAVAAGLVEMIRRSG